MIKINCTNCSNHCCGKNPNLTPVLTPDEEKRFKRYSIAFQTPYGTVRKLSKKSNGNCIFLDDNANTCTRYEERPLECLLYPYLLDFSKTPPSIKLDTRFCPHLQTLETNIPKILSLVRSQNFPQNWINAYNTLENC